ncbi:preprotein translocase subunit SecE [Acaryochloris sp. IP29b_bin.148]|uniref:preprotein translocase subunit SecE n=1 Tax=Acaryochloris sp. IP29b_bin.148 TaxID=2969218 RepID=UPI002633C4EB|nr:preprotein translocase subunit SecE [Acaryochloris sp. IP29b_bin.148]
MSSTSVDGGAEQLSSTAANPDESSGETAESSAQPTQGRPAAASGSTTGFFQGTKEELEKVVWPDRQQLISESIAVFLMVSLSAFIISFIDNLFSWVSTLVFG